MSKELTVGESMRKELMEFEIEEKRFELDQRKAKAFGSSMMLPQHLRDLGSIMVLNQMSNDLRIPMLLLAQNIFMVKGKIGMSAQLVISLVNGSKIYDGDIKFEERTEPFGVRAYAFKDGERVDGIWIDEDMIIANGWYSNSNWKSLKPLMARYRSATYFARLNCPMVLMGFQTDAEIEDTGIITEVIEDRPQEKKRSLNSVVSKVKEEIKETVPDEIVEVQEEDLLKDIEVEVATDVAELSPLDEMKIKADDLGIKYRSDIGIKTLTEKLRVAEYMEEIAEVPEDDQVEEVMAKEIVQEQEAMADEIAGDEIEDELSKKEKILNSVAMYKETPMSRKDQSYQEAVKSLAERLKVMYVQGSTSGRILELIEEYANTL